MDETESSEEAVGVERRAGARVYLVRHGRTPLNAAGVLRGRLDPPLDEMGQWQAEQLGRLFARRPIGLVVASPLRRAVETAQAIATPTGLPVETDGRLIDREYGRWAGGSKEVVLSQWGSLEAAPDVEPSKDVRSRALDALADVARKAAGGAAVVVSHDVVIRLSLVALDPSLGDPEELPQGTGCFNTLEYQTGAWKVLRINEGPASGHPTDGDHLSGSVGSS